MLEQELAELAKAIRNVVVAYKSVGSAKTSHLIIRVHRRDLILMYREDICFAYFPSERTEIEGWDWEDQIRFQDSVIEAPKEFKVVTDALGKGPESLKASPARLPSRVSKGLTMLN